MNVIVGGRTLDANVQYRAKDSKWLGRESVDVRVKMTYAEAMSVFVDDVNWSTVSEYTDENGAVQRIETDMSAYALSGAITDNRDGTVTIRVGKPLPDEIIRITLAEAPHTRKEAEMWRSTIETAMQSIEDDAVALAAAPLYPAWSDLPEGTEVAIGMRIRHNGKLYRVITTHNVSTAWRPGEGTESLYVRIDEIHGGTDVDPIPYEGNMALVNGLYYTQGGVVYLCNRDTENPVYNTLAELVGLYVEVVS